VFGQLKAHPNTRVSVTFTNGFTLGQINPEIEVVVYSFVALPETTRVFLPLDGTLSNYRHVILGIPEGWGGV